jgi:acetylornithine deacetylase/succinyl-diaminopimelate desuccinylase-like protein
MYLANLKTDSAKRATPRGPELISQDYLRHVVESIAIPRHFDAEPENNARVGDWIADEFRSLGLQARVVGETENVVVWYPGADSAFKVLISAHFDSVPGSPGADDNASAVAAMIAAAKALKGCTDAAILFVAFNREEDGLLGSRGFAQSLDPKQVAAIECVHAWK